MLDELLTVKNISKSFGGIRAVSDFSFSVTRNSITALIGPNGAGKTTVFNLISRIYEADSGAFYFNDKNITNYKSFELAKLGISRTFQNVVLFPNMSLIENVMLGGHISGFSSIAGYLFSFFSSGREDKKLRAAAEENLALVGLKDKIGAEISGLAFGQLRLAEIARSLMAAPDLLMLDEPAAGLNPKETEELADLLFQIKKLGKTILIVEHDMNLVMTISNKIVVMNFGQFLAEGNAAQILENQKVISAYLGSSERN